MVNVIGEVSRKTSLALRWDRDDMVIRPDRIFGSMDSRFGRPLQ